MGLGNVLFVYIIKEGVDNSCNLLSPTHSNTIYGINITRNIITFDNITCTIIKSNSSTCNIT